MLAAWAVALALSGQALAQYSPLVTPSWYDYGVQRQQTLNSWNIQRRMQSVTPRVQPQTPRAPSPAVRRTGTITFTPVASSLIPALIAAEKRQNEAERRELQEALERFLSQYRQGVRQHGGTANDLARAAAFYITANYTAGTGAGLSDAQVQGVREQMRLALLEDETIQRMSNRERQLAFETMAIIGSMMLTGFELGRDPQNADVAASTRRAGRRALQEFLHTPFERIRITDKGVEFR